MSAPLRVRGACPKCRRVVNTVAPKGRATWRGECPEEGCDGRINARRIKPAAAAATSSAEPAGDQAPAPAPAGRRRRRPITKVDAYDRTSRPSADRGTTRVQSTGRAPEPEPEPAGDGGDAPAGDGGGVRLGRRARRA